MHTKIERFGSTPMGTFGILRTHNDMDLAFSCLTVERPWLDNKPMISCVPAGDYALEPHDSRRFSNTFALIGETVSHWPEEGVRRSACLVHAANHWQQVNGCIALGATHGFVDGQWAILNSRATVGEWLDLLHSVDESHTLSIEWKSYQLCF